MSTVPRALLVLAVGLCCVGTSCFKVAGFALAPRPEWPEDSAEGLRSGGLAIVAGVAARRGLAPAPEHARSFAEPGWECFSGRDLLVCAKATGRELQFRFQQTGFRFTPWADSLRLELADSLRARFGPESVRDCAWQSEVDPERSDDRHVALRSVCAPMRQRGS